MKALWQRYAGRFDALSLRERAMVAAAALVVLLALAYTQLIEPEILKERRIRTALLQKQSETRALEAQVAKLIAAGGGGAASAQRERLAALKSSLAEVEARIAAEERRFTAPAAMRSVVEGVLAKSPGVELVELKTLAVAPLGKPEKNERLIYRHGLELTVSGSYLDLLAYLRSLEALPSRLYWGALQLDATGYPKLSLKLTVYTLSLDRAWLHV